MRTRSRKKVYLSEKKYIGGVVGGLAEYLEFDATVLRLITIALLILTGLMPIVLFYVLAWLVIPRQEKGIRDAEYTVVE